jgi:hypothetical protein
MAKRKSQITYGKSFRTKSKRGKFAKGSLIRYKYVDGKKSTVVKGKK